MVGLVLTIAGIVESQESVVARRPSRPPESAAAAKASVKTDPSAALFEFHSSFFVNLHQTLLHEAFLRKGAPDRRLERNQPLPDATMTDPERKTWNRAVDFYEARFQGRRELFDDGLVKINGILAREVDTSQTLGTGELPEDVAEVLRSAAPVYMSYWWRGHDAANRKWILSMRPLVDSLGPKIAAAIERDLKEGWPAVPIHLDVCYFVPEIGHAFTTNHPAHTTLSSSAPTLGGLNGFETLFHEASHTFADTMADALLKECAAAKKECGDLWHGVLFFTTGEETRRALPEPDQAVFQPYAYKNGLYERGEYPKYRRVLEKDWQPYLEGKIDFARAIRQMVADL